MPAEYVGSRVVMYNPITGSPMQYGSTGPIGYRPVTPITPFATSQQSGHTEYVVVCQSPTSGLIVMEARVRRACGELYYHVESGISGLEPAT